MAKCLNTLYTLLKLKNIKQNRKPSFSTIFHKTQQLLYNEVNFRAIHAQILQLYRIVTLVRRLKEIRGKYLHQERRSFVGKLTKVQCWYIIFDTKLSWFGSELVLDKDISNMVVQCKLSTCMVV